MLKHTQSIMGPILLGGLIAGTIDVGAAALINSLGIGVILKAIAGGLLGEDSFKRGMEAEWLGLFLQWAMSILIAAIFVVASRRLPVLRRNWLASGLAYGVVVYFVMNYVVVPLSALHAFPHFKLMSFIENMLAMLVFGVIIAFFARQRTASLRSSASLNPKSGQ